MIEKEKRERRREKRKKKGEVIVFVSINRNNFQVAGHVKCKPHLANVVLHQFLVHLED